MRVGLTVRDLAHLSDLHEDTVYRFLRNGSANARSRRAIERALSAYEVGLRDYLTRLHSQFEKVDAALAAGRPFEARAA